MKRNFKRVFAVILTLVMILSSVPFSAYATENEATVEQGNNDVSVSSTNSLGDMITETLDNESLDTDGDYVITDLTFENQTATVSYMALENCNLVVAVYDENTMQMLASEVLILFSDEVSASVTFIDALPEFFVAKAFLVDLDYAPLCKEYVSRKNTTEFVEFMETKSTDFEEDKVINLDASDDNNFLVLSDDAQKIKGDAETNVLVSSDTETNTYVFENIDSSISSLKKGDIFHLDNGDMENLVVIKVASITVDGTTATIVAESSSLEEIFDYVKLDSDELKYNVSTDSAESGIISEDGIMETDAWESTNEDDPWKKTETFPFNKEFNNEKGDNIVINGSATFTLEARYKIYIDLTWAEVSFILNPSAVLTVTVSGTLTEREIKLGHIYFSMYGVTIGAEPVLVISASGSITLTGTLKTQIGFAFNTSDGFVNKSQKTTFEPEVKISGEFYIGFNLSPYLSFLRAKDSSVVDIKLKTEFGITIKASYSNNSGHECDNCIDGDLLWSAKINVDLAILYGLIDTSDNKNYKKDLWSKKPTKFADFYYSFDHNEFGWGECPYGGSNDNPIDPDIPNESGVVDCGECGDNLTWTLYNDGELKITGIGEMDDYNNQSSRPWYSHRSVIKSVTISESVATIGAYAFYECTSLVSVTIPNGVTKIGQYAFCKCTSLVSVTIPDSVTVIESLSFHRCDSLISITVEADNQYFSSDAYGVLYNKNKKRLIKYPAGNKRTLFTIPDSITEIASYSFNYCDSLTNVTIPASINGIGTGAFGHCPHLIDITVDADNQYFSSDSYGVLYNKDKTNLIQYPIGNERTSFTVPNSVTLIKNGAFSSCSILTSVIIPNSVTTIGNVAFSSCENLASVIIGNSVTTIDNSAFRNCTSLTDIKIPDSVITIGDYAFYDCTKLNSVTIGDGVTTIGALAFSLCTSLTSVAIGNNVTIIGVRAFDNCVSLMNVTISDSVTTIGGYAFANCDSLTSVTIGNRVARIEEEAFYDCTSLTSITIPVSVTYIGKYAFRNCYRLTDVYYNGSQTQWNKMTIGVYGNDYLERATIHFNTTGSTTDSVSEFFVDSVGEMIEVTDSLEKCFTYGGCASGGSYTLVTVTENMETLALSNENILYFDQVVANDCGMISTDFLPKAQIEGCVTLLIGDFGNGTEARVVTTTTYTAGDINLDAAFDGMDAIVVACVVNGMLTQEQIGTKKFEVADANFDGVIDTVDVTYLENEGLYLS